MTTPIITILKDFPEIGIPNNPIVLYNGGQLLVCYEISLTDNKFAVIEFEGMIEYKVTPINDEGIGKHKYAKFGLNWYSIHEITNIEEIDYWKSIKPKYWVFTFQDRTVEVLGTKINIVNNDCDVVKLKSIVSDFTNKYL
jgi:hypothetical protein